MKLFVKKALTFVLTLATALSAISVAGAYDANNSAVNNTKAAFDALPDDAIVCYVMDTPVYKYEIDETGYIHKDFSDSVVSTCASGGVQTGTLATKHKSETITANMIQVYTGYSETNEITYLHKTEAKNTAAAFLSGASKNYAIAQALGSYGGSVASSSPYYAAVAGVIGGVVILDAVSKETVANNLTNTVSSNNGAKLIHANSKYGSFYNVSAWNGSTVYKPCTYTTSNATITISAVNCSHGSVW